MVGISKYFCCIAQKPVTKTETHRGITITRTVQGKTEKCEFKIPFTKIKSKESIGDFVIIPETDQIQRIELVRKKGELLPSIHVGPDGVHVSQDLSGYKIEIPLNPPSPGEEKKSSLKKIPFPLYKKDGISIAQKSITFYEENRTAQDCLEITIDPYIPARKTVEKIKTATTTALKFLWKASTYPIRKFPLPTICLSIALFSMIYPEALRSCMESAGKTIATFANHKMKTE